MIEQILQWIHFDQWRWLLPWMFGFSVIVFIGSLIGVWLVLVHLPEDYLTNEKPVNLLGFQSKLINVFIKVVRNLMGLGFLLVGMVMLLTPGQGILSIVVGIVFLEFPGKRKLIHKIVAFPRVLNSINAIRRKANKPPLLTPQAATSAEV